MFSGLVEQTSSVFKVSKKEDLLQLKLERPSSFPSVQTGDSFCVDGLCLTLESFDKQSLAFSLGPETLKITGWTPQKIKNKTVNLERSLTLQSALGGHFLTGHIDGLAQVQKLEKKGKSLLLTVLIPGPFKKFFWKKGYIALNGVSLTVNKIKGRSLEVCLIPETLKRSNLSQVKEGDDLNFEVDYLSRFFIHGFNYFWKTVLIITSLFFFLLFVSLLGFFLVIVT